MWGKIKISGDDWMYPKPLMDLSGWNIRCMDSGNMHHFAGADNSCISWGHAQYGELGYGPEGQKSSSIPKKVNSVENMHVLTVACGLGLSMVVVDRTGVADRLDQIEVFDGEVPTEDTEEPSKSVPKKTTKKDATNTSKDGKKRKKAKESSESEDESNGANSQSDDEDEERVNGSTDKKRQQGSKAGRGRGRGRGQGTSAADKVSQANGHSERGRGRPRKQH